MPKKPLATLPDMSDLTPHQAIPPFDATALLALIRAEFAYMEGRIDPPSSMRDLTPEAITAQAATGEVWAMGQPPVACVFLTARPDALYLGKLAVAVTHRRRGLARRLIALAEDRARSLGLPALELQTRVELTANHTAFARLGFAEIGRTAHAGFSRPTSITFRKPL